MGILSIFLRFLFLTGGPRDALNLPEVLLWVGAALSTDAVNFSQAPINTGIEKATIRLLFWR
jgi:hypothetical protein